MYTKKKKQKSITFALGALFCSSNSVLSAKPFFDLSIFRLVFVAFCSRKMSSILFVCVHFFLFCLYVCYFYLFLNTHMFVILKIWKLRLADKKKRKHIPLHGREIGENFHNFSSSFSFFCYTNYHVDVMGKVRHYASFFFSFLERNITLIKLSGFFMLIKFSISKSCRYLWIVSFLVLFCFHFLAIFCYIVENS